MSNLFFLKGLFQESSILNLVEIFDIANTTECDDILKKLKLDLLCVLQQEMSINFIKWEISPSGNNHIVVVDDLCLLFNIGGVCVLFKNVLFLDGELKVINFQWFEEDNLVVFDIHYIVHDEWQKCICHFAHNGFFAYLTPMREEKYPLNNPVSQELNGPQWV